MLKRTGASVKFAASIGAVFTLGMAFTPAFAADRTVLAKAGVDFDSRARDIDRCKKIAATAPVEDLPPTGSAPMGMVAGPPNAAGALGAGLAVAFVSAIDTAKARGLAAKLCLRNLGYAEVTLTPQEAAAYSKLSLSRQSEWEKSFLLRDDIASRVDAILNPAAPRLPPYRAAAFAHGGIKLDPESFQVVAKFLADPNKEPQVFLKGRAYHWRTALLAEPFNTPSGFIRVAGAKGAIFHQVDFRTERSPLLKRDGATWCGVVQQTSASSQSASDELYCFTGQDDGYAIYQASGYPWLAGTYNGGFRLPAFKGPIDLEELQSDPLGPFDFELRLVNADARSVTVAAYAVRDDQSVRFWQRRILFSEPTASLPFWTKKITFSRQPDAGLRVIITDDGSGAGWSEGD